MSGFRKAALGLLSTATLLSGCASEGAMNLKEGTVTLADGTTHPTNIFRQTSAGMGNTQICLADPNNLTAMASCSTTVGKARGTADVVIGAVGATGSLTYGAAAIKSAFAPAAQTVNQQASNVVVKDANGAVTVTGVFGSNPSRPAGGSKTVGGTITQTDTTTIDSVKNSTVLIYQGGSASLGFGPSQ